MPDHTSPTVPLKSWSVFFASFLPNTLSFYSFSTVKTVEFSHFAQTPSPGMPMYGAFRTEHGKQILSNLIDGRYFGKLYE